MDDHPSYEINEADDIAPCVAYIKAGIAKGTGTLVVCTAGMSRSATVCIAYLMMEHGMSYEDAFNKVKSARKYVKPNEGFEAFLKKLDGKLRGGLKPQETSTVASCELCNLERRTQWFEDHSKCRANILFKHLNDDFIICLCD